MTCIPLGTESA